MPGMDRPLPLLTTADDRRRAGPYRRLADVAAVLILLAAGAMANASSPAKAEIEPGNATPLNVTVGAASAAMPLRQSIAAEATPTVNLHRPAGVSAQ
jgi:hypothetical protein